LHNSYIIPGVDGSVILKQAFARANDKHRPPEPTAIHYHRHGEPCNSDCRLIPIGANELKGQPA
jgi:hypothetical protein